MPFGGENIDSAQPELVGPAAEPPFLGHLEGLDDVGKGSARFAKEEDVERERFALLQVPLVKRDSDNVRARRLDSRPEQQLKVAEVLRRTRCTGGGQRAAANEFPQTCTDRSANHWCQLETGLNGS